MQLEGGRRSTGDDLPDALHEGGRAGARRGVPERHPLPVSHVLRADPVSAGGPRPEARRGSPRADAGGRGVRAAREGDASAAAQAGQPAVHDAGDAHRPGRPGEDDGHPQGGVGPLAPDHRGSDAGGQRDGGRGGRASTETVPVPDPREAPPREGADAGTAGTGARATVQAHERAHAARLPGDPQAGPGQAGRAAGHDDAAADAETGALSHRERRPLRHRGESLHPLHVADPPLPGPHGAPFSETLSWRGSSAPGLLPRDNRHPGADGARGKPARADCRGGRTRDHRLEEGAVHGQPGGRDL